MCYSATINASPKIFKYLPTKYRINSVLQPITRYQSFVSVPTAVVYPPLAPAPILPPPVPFVPHVLPPPVFPAPNIAVLPPPVVAPPPVIAPPAPLPVYGEPLHF